MLKLKKHSIYNACKCSKLNYWSYLQEEAEIGTAGGLAKFAD